MTRIPSFAAVLAMFCFTAAAHAQQLTVTGRVVGPENAGLDSQRVVLHRIAGDAGATIAETTSGPDGAFVLDAPLSGDSTALLFVAVRYQGELYIGQAFREGEAAREQVLQVGVPGTSASSLINGDGTGAAPVAQQGGRPPTTRGWLLWLIPLVGVSAVALYAVIPRSRMPADRATFIRIAELDERMQGAPAAQRAALLDERQQLVSRLRG